MGVNSCMSVRTVRGPCHCPACPRAQTMHMPPTTVVLPPMNLETETTPTKEKKGSKMKVLKKIKKKIGLAPRTSCSNGTPNNLPPLTFHRIHGENVRISMDGYTARRVESFCKGVAFSARPVRVNEKVYIRFVEISSSWSGVLRFGFTNNDPANLENCLPKYACPDLTNKPGNWAKALGERFCEKDNILFYYVNATGDVNFGVNGEERGIFFTGVDTRYPLWSLVDVYGNCTAIQYADPRNPLQRRLLPSVEDAEERLANSLRNLSVEESVPPLRFQSQPFEALVLHRTKGRNVQYVNDRGVAARVDDEFTQGYVFTSRPLRPGQTIVVQILKIDPSYNGSLALGLTSCDPAMLRPSELPEDVESLLDRPEYWVVKKDAGHGLRRGDELAVTLTIDGEVLVSKNGACAVTVMHVDHTLRLWAFVDLYGATQKVRMLCSPYSVQPQQQQLRVQLASAGSPIASGSRGAVLVVSLPPQNGVPNNNHHQGLTLASAHYIEPMPSSSQVCLSNLPQSSHQNSHQSSHQTVHQPIYQSLHQTPHQSLHQTSNHTSHQSLHQTSNQPLHQPLHQPLYQPSHQPAVCSASSNQTWSDNVTCSNSQNNTNQQVLAELIAPIDNLRLNERQLPLPIPQHVNLNNINGPSSSHQPLYGIINDREYNLAGTECTICYENHIDTVLYMCGHMCMCYKCSIQQWKGKGGGMCPMCRAPIRDVIRTYKP